LMRGIRASWPRRLVLGMSSLSTAHVRRRPHSLLGQVLLQHTTTLRTARTREKRGPVCICVVRAATGTAMRAREVGPAPLGEAGFRASGGKGTPCRSSLFSHRLEIQGERAPEARAPRGRGVASSSRTEVPARFYRCAHGWTTSFVRLLRSRRQACGANLARIINICISRAFPRFQPRASASLLFTGLLLQGNIRLRAP